MQLLRAQSGSCEQSPQSVMQPQDVQITRQETWRQIFHIKDLKQQEWRDLYTDGFCNLDSWRRIGILRSLRWLGVGGSSPRHKSLLGLKAMSIHLANLLKLYCKARDYRPSPARNHCSSVRRLKSQKLSIRQDGRPPSCLFHCLGPSPFVWFCNICTGQK